MRFILLLGMAFYCLAAAAQESPDSNRLDAKAYLQAVKKQAAQIDQKFQRGLQTIETGQVLAQLFGGMLKLTVKSSCLLIKLLL